MSDHTHDGNDKLHMELAKRAAIQAQLQRDLDAERAYAVSLQRLLTEAIPFLAFYPVPYRADDLRKRIEATFTKAQSESEINSTPARGSLPTLGGSSPSEGAGSHLGHAVGTKQEAWNDGTKRAAILRPLKAFFQEDDKVQHALGFLADDILKSLEGWHSQGLDYEAAGKALEQFLPELEAMSLDPVNRVWFSNTLAHLRKTLKLGHAQDSKHD